MIQFLHSGLQGAPSNTANAGAVCSILDDCLVNGFNVLAPVTATISGGVATFVYASAHGYTADQYLRVAGAGQAQVNGDKLPTIVNTQTLTVPAPGAPDGPAGGSVQTRFAPLGWATAFSGTNVRVYRSPNPQSTRMFYRLQDTGVGEYTSGTHMRGFESMTDASTGTGPFPTDAQSGGGMAGGVVFSKSSDFSASPWMIVGDDRTVYVMLNNRASAGTPAGWSFGDFDSYRDGDQYNAVIMYQGSGDALGQGYSGNGQFCPRAATQLGSGIVLGHGGPLVNGSGSATYPSGIVDGFTLHRPVLLSEGTSPLYYRGQHRGLMHVNERVTLANGRHEVFSGLNGVTGRVLVTACGTTRRVAFALDEPW